MHWVRALTLPVLMIVTAACGGSPAASVSSTGSEPTDNPAASVAESTPGASVDGGGGGDLDAMIAALTPPNSTELTRTSAEGGVFVGWSSTDSVDTLKSFYEGAIAGTGMEVFSTTNASGTYAWVFAESEGSSNGGSVTIGPASDGTDGASVIVTLTSE